LNQNHFPKKGLNSWPFERFTPEKLFFIFKKKISNSPLINFHVWALFVFKWARSSFEIWHQKWWGEDFSLRDFSFRQIPTRHKNRRNWNEQKDKHWISASQNFLSIYSRIFVWNVFLSWRIDRQAFDLKPLLKFDLETSHLWLCSNKTWADFMLIILAVLSSHKF
jgi:hypothetical protein